MVRKIWSLSFIAFVLVLTSFLPVQSVSANPLSDIPDRSSEEINYLIQRGVILGFPDGTLKPKDPVTRQEAATLVGRALELNGEKRSTNFPDVPKASYASGYIQSAYDEKIITGYPDGTYKPQNYITRGEMAFLISKAFSLTSTSGEKYSDIPTDGALTTAIDRVSTAGIANGYPDGTYKPGKSITREEFSLLIARGLNPKFKVDGTNTKPDQPMAEKYVSTSILNVRTGPGVSYEKVGKLSLGTKVTIYKEVGDWCQISYNGTRAYVHGAYLLDKLKEKRVIAIDAGHGGYDGGASANSVLEKEVNLAVSKKVRDLLEKSGIEVIMTREDDTYISLDGRVKHAVDNGADTFVSIHSNAFPNNESVSGIETFYSSAALNDRAYKSYKLASFIHDRLVEAMEMKSRGVKDVPYRVIHATPLPSALVELGFLTNSSDASKLGSTYWQEKASKAIYLGVIDYYNWIDK
ncbi:N-acetylmuramoyl-L-alanine amidase [Halobacillus yeomjeoni]|uniref:N-acetylmuramoyl-L-alanine amidase n=1 Tax=Halobacillus yeomjeoni TaxID=311194 RepID=UPI001CD6B0D2|nr:N-acetylmuramoyl-L-alanine amidase [Halobacillus yeomjeoni]MCA0985199.1 N-acetylmuramoyl-L-alanine amidase [Halobacillus yeomjeoni]